MGRRMRKKNILPADTGDRQGKVAKAPGGLRYLGSIEGPADLSATVDKTVYGAEKSSGSRP
jgi:hypothetical protein